MTGHRILAVCFDFGDTLVDEASEVKDETNTSISGELIPGAGEVLHELDRRGYKLALVADGRPGTYRNVLSQHGLYGLFDAIAISEELGVEKPGERMYVHALGQLRIKRGDYSRTVMVGNRLDRDVRGANQLGMISIWMDWAPRYPKLPSAKIEQPRFRVREPLEILQVIESLERADAPDLVPRNSQRPTSAASAKERRQRRR